MAARRKPAGGSTGPKKGKKKAAKKKTAARKGGPKGFRGLPPVDAIIAVVESVEARVQAVKVPPAQQAARDHALRVLGGIKRQLRKLCYKSRKKELNATWHFIPRPE